MLDFKKNVGEMFLVPLTHLLHRHCDKMHIRILTARMLRTGLLALLLGVIGLYQEQRASLRTERSDATNGAALRCRWRPDDPEDPRRTAAEALLGRLGREEATAMGSLAKTVAARKGQEKHGESMGKPSDILMDDHGVDVNFLPPEMFDSFGESCLFRVVLLKEGARKTANVSPNLTNLGS